MKRLLQSAFLAAALAAPAAPALAQSQWRTLPAIPVAGEEFVLQVFGTGFGLLPPALPQSTTLVEGTIVSLITDLSPFPSAGGPTPSFLASAVAIANVQGDHDAVRITRFAPPTTQDRESLSGFRTLAPRPAATPTFRSLSGNWFAQAENGTGWNIIQGANGNLFAVWFNYRTTAIPEPAAPLWLVAPGGKWVSPTSFRAVLYETRGSTFDVAFDPARFGVRPVGIVTFDFVDANTVDFNAQFALDTFDLIEKQSRIQRQQF